MSKEKMLGYSGDDKPLYEDLTQKANSPFYKKSYADVFLSSVSWAIYKNLKPSKSLKKRQPNIPLSAFKKGKIWLIYSIFISKESDYEVLFDLEKLYSVSEKYADSGIKSLHNEVFSSTGDFAKKMRSETLNYLKKQLDSDKKLSEKIKLLKD